MKLLLYCVKAKPYLYKTEKPMIEKKFRDYHTQLNKAVLNQNCLNGKIVAECDFEVKWYDTSWGCMLFREHNGLEKSCLTYDQLVDYVKGKNEFYAIHIKNLHIFDEPKELSDYESFAGYKKYYQINDFIKLEKTPKNMCKVLKPYIRFNRDFKAYEDFDILISIRPEWLCKILNREKIIEVRKKVLKEMLK